MTNIKMLFTKNNLPKFNTFEDFRSIAKKKLPKMVFDFVDGGAENRYKFGIVIPSYSGSLLMKVKIFLPEKKSDFISEVAFFRWDGKGKLKKIKIGS